MIRVLVRRLLRSSEIGSMPMAMLISMIGISLSALLAPMVQVQIHATRTDANRARALHAAAAGLDVALGHIRAARDANGDGARAKLPCNPISGAVSAAGNARYNVTIDYLATDPRGMSSAWVAANRFVCTPGSGTQTTPAFALLTSQGTDLPTDPLSGATSRTLQATYTLSTTDVTDIPGGLIHVYKISSSGGDLCLDAGSATPAAGTTLRVGLCSAGSAQQTFIYDTNLNLVLASSKSTASPLGMCVDADIPHAAGGAVTLQPCAQTTQPRQQWSFTWYLNFEGTTDGSATDGYCLNVQTPDTAGSAMVLGSTATGTCQSSPTNTKESFEPENAVGAGAAGTTSGQLVNLREYGRCLDVSYGDVKYSYLIVWQCKQAPDPANVDWNQRWTLPVLASGATSAQGKIATQPSTSTKSYCLKSPLSAASKTYVTLTACPNGTLSPALTWTRYENTGSSKTRYTIIDSAGNCLAPTDPDAPSPDFHTPGYQVSKGVVAPCDGSTLQKWNAPPSLLRATLKDIAEK